MISCTHSSGICELAQRVGEFVDIRPRVEVGRRTLQHRDVLAVVGHRRDQRRSGRTRTDHEHPLARVVEVVGPGLRVHDLALVALHARASPGCSPPNGGSSPQHIHRKPHVNRRSLAGVGALDVEHPALVVTRPVGPHDRVLVADVASQIVLVDHLVHVGQDLVGRGDRRAGPRLEAVPEGVEIAVGANARIGVLSPGTTEGVLGLEQHEALVGQCCCR